MRDDLDRPTAGAEGATDGFPAPDGSVDIEALKAQHSKGHGPSGICAGPEHCSSVRYLAVIERQAGGLVTKRETLRAIYQCRLNNGNGSICRACWLEAGRWRQ